MTLKKTLAAVAALTIASMTVATTAFAAEAETKTTTAAETTAAAETTTAAETTAAETTAAETTAAETTAEASAEDFKGGEASNGTITIATVTAKPGSVAEVPVTISKNPGFSGTGIVINFGKLTPASKKSEGLKSGLISPNAYVVKGNNVSIASSNGGDDITGDGALYTLLVKVPDDAKAGDKYPLTLTNIASWSNGKMQTILPAHVNGAIVIGGAETTTEAATTTANKGGSKVTPSKTNSSPATGEALPIAGAVAAIAVIGGVAYASRKRK